MNHEKDPFLNNIFFHEKYVFVSFLGSHGGIRSKKTPSWVFQYVWIGISTSCSRVLCANDKDSPLKVTPI